MHSRTDVRACMIRAPSDAGSLSAEHSIQAPRCHERRVARLGIGATDYGNP